jgi:hypothetical protein
MVTRSLYRIARGGSWESVAASASVRRTYDIDGVESRAQMFAARSVRKGFIATRRPSMEKDLIKTERARCLARNSVFFQFSVWLSTRRDFFEGNTAEVRLSQIGKANRAEYLPGSKARALS